MYYTQQRAAAVRLVGGGRVVFIIDFPRRRIPRRRRLYIPPHPALLPLHTAADHFTQAIFRTINPQSSLREGAKRYLSLSPARAHTTLSLFLYLRLAPLQSPRGGSIYMSYTVIYVRRTAPGLLTKLGKTLKTNSRLIKSV